mmetsp:Transcript_20210/g.20314  ORF Transcript_20210/g.20314 Transcript_20210/m.20314 type:complete len:99 (+) Transcript_20210:1-297(+)
MRKDSNDFNSVLNQKTSPCFNRRQFLVQCIISTSAFYSNPEQTVAQGAVQDQNQYGDSYTSLDSGLKYFDIRSGTGPSPVPGATCVFHLVGRLADKNG